MQVWAAVRPTSSRRYLRDERIRFIELDLGNDLHLQQQLQNHLEAENNQPFDYVIHAAGVTKCRHAEDFFAINAEGTARLAINLLATKALRPAGRFVFISSLSVMGPVHEHDYAPITEHDLARPNTAYGASKLQAEALLAEIKDLNYIVLRPTGVYGPRERDYAMMADSIRHHIDFAVGYKPQVLTFIYVADLVDAAFLALTHGRTGRKYFLTDGKEYTSRTFSDLIQMRLGIRHVCHIVAPLWVLWVVCRVAAWLARLTGGVSTLNADKYRIMRQRSWRCDIQPARNELGYHPQWPLTRGVEATFN